MFVLLFQIPRRGNPVETPLAVNNKQHFWGYIQQYYDSAAGPHVCNIQVTGVMVLSWILSVKVFRTFSRRATPVQAHWSLRSIDLRVIALILPLWICACPKTLRSSHWSESQSELTSFLDNPGRIHSIPQQHNRSKQLKEMPGRNHCAIVLENGYY